MGWDTEGYRVSELGASTPWLPSNPPQSPGLGQCGSLLLMREPLAQDTSPEAERVMLDIYRQMPVWRKMEMVDDAIRTGRQLAMAGLRARYPNEGLQRLRRRLYAIALGEELAEEAYGPLEKIA